MTPRKPGPDRPSLRIAFTLGLLAASAACESVVEPGKRKNDALMLSDNVAVTRAADGWVANPPGVAANVVMATDARLDGFEDVSANCQLFRSVVSWDSVEGVSPITMRTSLQAATATWNGSNYVVEGLQGAAVFASEDAMTVEYDDGSSTVSETLTAPSAPADPTTSLGEPDGLGTMFHMPSDVDMMFTYVYAPDLTGDNGLLCSVDVADLAPDDRGGLAAPLVDSDAAAALGRTGLVVQSVNVAYYTMSYSQAFFPDAERPIPLQAGRMFTLSGADLGL